ncbi:lysosomal amino acid transporter 1 homolog [Osmerus eperlanus]|uniref:lysosomal amino acid transporter 1 homolog n=1 Tax=Osmerus eperlanus TaxID=29151 RepID=UPI002E14BA45
MRANTSTSSLHPRSRLRKLSGLRRNSYLRPMAHTRFQEKGADVAAANVSYVQGRPLCVNGTPWILYLLDECVQNMSEYWSVVIGLISMFCFLLSTVPQVYEAYRNGKVEEAMSFGFLLFLISGDLSSLMGCYLTNQLPIQIITGVFYIFTDMSLISQFLYYKIKNSSSKKLPFLKWLCFLWSGLVTLVLLGLPKLILRNSISIDSQSPNYSLEVYGYTCGYLASVFYLSSRFPQLHKNFKRQSTEGTSYLLFALAMMGNSTYGLSLMVVLPALQGSKRVFILKHLPWLIGSLGVLLLDLLITVQFIKYRKNRSSKTGQLMKVSEVEPLLCEEEELTTV